MKQRVYISGQLQSIFFLVLGDRQTQSFQIRGHEVFASKLKNSQVRLAKMDRLEPQKYLLIVTTYRFHHLLPRRLIIMMFTHDYSSLCLPMFRLCSNHTPKYARNSGERFPVTLILQYLFFILQKFK